MINAETFGQELAGIVKAATTPLLARIDALEKALADMPVPKDGKDGTDGRDGADGSPGKEGAHGRDGIDGKDGADGARGDAGEKGADGRDGQDGAPGADGRDGADGKDGEKGSDGIGLAGAMIDREGGLVLTMSNGDTKALGVVVGKDGMNGRDGSDGAKGADGANGRDGLGFEDMEFDTDAHGRVVAKFVRGDLVKTVRLPGITDMGVHRADGEYLKGDAVSYGGSLWIAQEDGPEGRPDTGKGWRMAVKKGRDGRDLKPKGA
ncbi:hypothetical protein [Falsirhodobacter xinxiangensis]|uniref:hypothetical protein n=1 Tax=Falsirhodobacter xinxiangensis TaxID=2530049 RepID=UPI0010AA6500|nr:hypothetical protein [Rhodobacter xinxiangensis]